MINPEVITSCKRLRGLPCHQLVNTNWEVWKDWWGHGGLGKLDCPSALWKQKIKSVDGGGLWAAISSVQNSVSPWDTLDNECCVTLRVDCKNKCRLGRHGLRIQLQWSLAKQQSREMQCRNAKRILGKPPWPPSVLSFSCDAGRGGRQTSPNQQDTEVWALRGEDGLFHHPYFKYAHPPNAQFVWEARLCTQASRWYDIHPPPHCKHAPDIQHNCMGSTSTALQRKPAHRTPNRPGAGAESPRAVLSGVTV